MGTPSDPPDEPAPAPLQADFVPPADAPAEDPYLRDSAVAQELFERAVVEADAGDEERAVVHLLRAAKLAETAREWHLAARNRRGLRRPAPPAAPRRPGPAATPTRARPTRTRCG